MGNTVTMQFEASTAKYVSDVLKAREALESTAQKAKESGDTIAGAGDRAAKGYEKIKQGAESARAATKVSADATTEAYTGVGASMLSLAAVAGTVSKLWSEHMQSMAEKTKSLREENDKLSKTLSNTGELSTTNFQAVKAGVGSIQSDMFSGKDIVSLYSSIAKKGGSENTIEEKKRATELAVRAGESGIEDVEGFGGTAAFLMKHSREGGAFEGMSDRKLGSMAAEITKVLPGGISEQQERFFNRSKDKNQALNLILAASKSSESARGLETLEVEADTEPDAELLKKSKHHKSKLTEDERRRLDLAQIPQQDRIGAMLADPSLVPAKAQRLVANLKKDFEESGIQDAVKNDELGRRRADFQTLERNDTDFGATVGARRLDVKEQNLKDRKRLNSVIRDNASRGRSLENAEVYGIDPGIRADLLGATGRANDAARNVGGAVLDAASGRALVELVSLMRENNKLTAQQNKRTQLGDGGDK